MISIASLVQEMDKLSNDLESHGVSAEGLDAVANTLSNTDAGLSEEVVRHLTSHGVTQAMIDSGKRDLSRLTPAEIAELAATLTGPDNRLLPPGRLSAVVEDAGVGGEGREAGAGRKGMLAALAVLLATQVGFARPLTPSEMGAVSKFVHDKVTGTVGGSVGLDKVYDNGFGSGMIRGKVHDAIEQSLEDAKRSPSISKMLKDPAIDLAGWTQNVRNVVSSKDGSELYKSISIIMRDKKMTVEQAAKFFWDKLH